MISSVAHLVLCSHLGKIGGQYQLLFFSYHDRLMIGVLHFIFCSISSTCLSVSSCQLTIWQDCDLLKINSKICACDEREDGLYHH